MCLPASKLGPCDQAFARLRRRPRAQAAGPAQADPAQVEGSPVDDRHPMIFIWLLVVFLDFSVFSTIPWDDYLCSDLSAFEKMIIIG